MKTASGLVNYTIAQLGLPYWWGGYGQTASASLLIQMQNLYPSVYNSSLYSNAKEQFGKRVHDCVGLIKGYRWSETPTSNPVYNPSQDVAVPGLYNQCSKRGVISTMPDQPGVCVFMKDMSHVGVYIGGGYVVEARGHAYGVVKTQLSTRGWSLWGMPDWIKYDTEKKEYTDYFSELSEHDKESILKLPTISKGTKEHGYAGALQMLLVFYGSVSIEVDGDFGTKTQGALIKWQSDHNLEADGIAGKQTWSSFFA